ncbi:hypothetical protein [Stappia sp.]|uniref:hypothetical protein n=1 Tax=Stappia sp. TaxID=1870903 RepID=UPI003D0E9765
MSAYQQMQQWKAKQKAHSQKFLNQQAVASNVFAVGVSETQTATEMLFNNVAQRVKNEAKAKIAQQNGAIDQAIESLDSAKTGDKKTEGVDIKV